MATTPQTMTMFAPDGTTGDIPLAKVRDAQASGFTAAVTMQSPDGKSGFIPASKVHDAAAKGFKMVPMDAPPEVKASYWDALTNPVGSGAQEQGVLGGVEQVGGQAMKTMAQPVIHPIDTLVGMYNTIAHPIDTAKGVVQNFQNDRQQGGLPLAVENATGQALGAYEGGRAATPVIKAATAGLPGAVGRAALLGRTPEAAYESALKPSTVLSQAERDAAIQTALKNGLPVTKGGFEKLSGLLDDYNQKIAVEIGKDPTRPIDPNSVATRADIAKAKFAKQVNAGGDLQAIEDSKQQFLKEQGATNGNPAPPMTAEDAQAMKQGTYRVLAGKFGEQGSASVEAQKALARGLKEEIATQFPEIGRLNAEESKLLDLQPLLERAVNRTANHQSPIGIGAPIAGSAASAITGSGAVGGVVTALKGVLDNPAIKSRLAIAVGKGGKMPYSQALAKVGAYSTALGAATSQGASNDDTPNQSSVPGGAQ